MFWIPIGNPLVCPVSHALVMSSVVRHMFATSPQLRSGPVFSWKLFGLML
jgi:hypothetical protein